MRQQLLHWLTEIQTRPSENRIWKIFKWWVLAKNVSIIYKRLRGALNAHC